MPRMTLCWTILSMHSAVWIAEVRIDFESRLTFANCLLRFCRLIAFSRVVCLKVRLVAKDALWGLSAIYLWPCSCSKATKHWPSCWLETLLSYGEAFASWTYLIRVDSSKACASLRWAARGTLTSAGGSPCRQDAWSWWWDLGFSFHLLSFFSKTRFGLKARLAFVLSSAHQVTLLKTFVTSRKVPFLLVSAKDCS